MRKLFVLLVSAAALASAAETHRLTLHQPSVVNGTTLKPGSYKMTVDNDKITIMQGKENVAEAKVAVEQSQVKNPATSVRYASAGGKYEIKEIFVGGTKTKLVLNN